MLINTGNKIAPKNSNSKKAMSNVMNKVMASGSAKVRRKALTITIYEPSIEIDQALHSLLFLAFLD